MTDATRHEPEFWIFGHACYSTEEDNPPEQDYMVWRYCDSGELAEGSAPRRCPLCDELPTREGCDPCLGRLPGVRYACCGHGIPDHGYIMFNNGCTLRGSFDHVNKRVEGLLELVALDSLGSDDDQRPADGRVPRGCGKHVFFSRLTGFAPRLG
jgi:hypothetical protein